MLNYGQLGGLSMEITTELGQFKDATCLWIKYLFQSKFQCWVVIIFNNALIIHL